MVGKREEGRERGSERGRGEREKRRERGCLLVHIADVEVTGAEGRQ